MPAAKHVTRKVEEIYRLLPLTFLALSLLAFPNAFPGISAGAVRAQEAQDPSLFRDELEVVRLVNQERRRVGLAPLAWNAELTQAARWFARDVAENMDADYCGHADSQDGNSGDRMRTAGFIGEGTSAENAICGYASPAEALSIWMNSVPHRKNILTAELREAGVGYYRAASGKGYVVLDLAQDKAYAPLVINDEALTTGEQRVQLYLYDQEGGAAWHGAGPTQEMMIANTPDFAGAQWEPYVAEKTWSLAPGAGWRAVYVKTRDALGRTSFVHDWIYAGGSPSDADLSLPYATQVESGFTLKNLAGSGYTHIQFSLNWLADNSDEHFEKLSGSGEQRADADAIGGSSFYMAGGATAAAAWNWSGNPLGELPAVAYFRLKTDGDSGRQGAVLLTVNDGSADVAVRQLAISDFAAAGQYQEFTVPFTPTAAGNGMLILSVRRSGPAAISWDATSFYTMPAPISDPYTHTAPYNYYRSSGGHARLITPGGGDGSNVEGATFSAPMSINPQLGLLEKEAAPPAAVLRIDPTALMLATPEPGNLPPSATVALDCSGCGGVTWQIDGGAAWLTATIVDGQLQVQTDAAGLATGLYTTTITLSVAGRPDIPPVLLPISLLIGSPNAVLPAHLYIPAVARR